jgi:hypothetical protein
MSTASSRPRVRGLPNAKNGDGENRGRIEDGAGRPGDRAATSPGTEVKNGTLNFVTNPAMDRPTIVTGAQLKPT